MKNRWSIKNSPHAVRTLDDLKRTKGPAQAELGRGTLVSLRGRLSQPSGRTDLIQWALPNKLTV
jgi:hypothetical protein